MAMAMAKVAAFLLLALIAISMLQTTVLASGQQLNSNRYGPGSLKRHQCPSRCKRRCSRTSHLEPCIFFCNKCCTKCLCVPPGYSGNKAVCACYNNWKTQQGGPKCP